MGHGPLVLVRKLGAGALGTVYLAEHPSSGADFAVKVLHPHLADNPAVLNRFYMEARSAQSLVHPSVARVLDVRQAPSGHHCLLMEYVHGTALSHLPLPLPSAEVVFLLSQVLEGLEATHACGAVHRDIKPENLVLTTGRDGERRVKLLDFGMSATLAAGFSEEELSAGMVVGSPAYLAPELWVRAEPDGRADLYALAVVGYRLLTGRLPFGGGGRMGEMLLVHKPSKPLPPHLIEERVPPSLSAVLMQAMSLRPDERFASARAFRSALHEAMRRPAFGCLAPPAFHVRVEDPEGHGLLPVFVNDVSQEGLRIACDGTLPRLGARLEVELSLNGWVLACTCDVVRLLPAEEARTWGGRQGYILHFSEPSEDVRRLIDQALAPPPAEPTPDAELAQLLSRAAGCSQDPYTLLAVHPHADFAEVLRRVAQAESRLEPFWQRPLPAAQRQALEALRAKLDMARKTLCEPLARARFDASRGNFRGVARCLAAGMPPSAVARLRQAFLATRPDAEARARAFFDEGIVLEAQNVLDAALARYSEALRVDPLNVSLHRYYHSLAQRLRGAGEAPAHPVASP
ncbi:serine/threonine-protein kinase [Archangium sp.]|uniref:serine/threonine-protein kinase n=1 Tax=Archangium sp. TaxID=1872627 RepID=UPI002D5B4DB0|nr:serine/threonine-protein kinase [Archangium sp.]HYO59924.1 serine/threonine-protein kinase [Archangium sp.]